MTKFNWMKAIFFGIFIWAILFAVGLLLSATGVVIGIGALLTLAIIAAFVTYAFAVSASPQSATQALGYGLSFVVIGLLLDVLITRNLVAGLYSIWSYWLGYLFILVSPMVRLPSSEPLAGAV